MTKHGGVDTPSSVAPDPIHRLILVRDRGVGIGENGQPFRRTMLTVRQLLRGMQPHPRHPRCDGMVGVADVDLKNQPLWMTGLYPCALGNDYDVVIIGYRQAGSK